MDSVVSNNTRFAEIIGRYIDDGDLCAIEALAKISGRIISKRYELGLNQKEFARYMGVSQAMVSKWEGGDYNFTISTIASICEKLGLSFSIQIDNRKHGFAKAGNYEMDAKAERHSDISDVLLLAG